MASVPIPLQAVEHMYIVSEPVAQLPEPLPILRDLDAGIYLKGDTGKILLGGFEKNAKVWNAKGPDAERAFLELPEDWQQFEPFMLAGMHRLPVLAEVGIQHFMNGPESFTPDSKPLLGESPFLKGFFVAAGMNSTGMMSSAGVGKAMAEWLVDGEAPMDLWAVDIARFDRASANKNFLIKRMEEAVADVFAIHWPYKQATAGRDQRRSSLHQAFMEVGAVFGVPTGWERPLWYAANEAEQQIRYSFNEQCWWSAVAREAEATQNRVALYELTPFTKIDVAGPSALVLLQQLCANDIDVEQGRAVYTQLLNQHGGIEADVTVTRRGENDFRVISGAATRCKDLAWIKHQCDRLGLTAEVFDATSAEVVLGLMGPQSRTLLQSLSETDLSNTAFPFATSKLIDVGMATLRATRVSFVGELGWELYIPTEYAFSVYQALIVAGEAFGLAHTGHLALDACRLEKGFRHWGHDIGPEETPLEAGLSFVVAWDKPNGFIGRDALLKQRETGVSKRLLMFQVNRNNPQPLLLHDEPIYCDGKLVGCTTSGSRGFRTDLSLCMGYVSCESGTAKSDLLQNNYEIGVAGERFRLEPLKRPPYDPDGSRMRS